MSEARPREEDPGRDLVHSLLQRLGFRASLIPESASKTPDVSVELSNERVLIEVESKQDDLQLRKLIDSPPGTTRGYKPTSVETMLCHAWHQIRDYPGRNRDDYALIWVVSGYAGIIALTWPTAMALLYGLATLSGTMSSSGKPYEKPCYFFGYSFFYRRPELDGVVMQDRHRLTLCLNSRSRRFERFKRTEIAELFRTHYVSVDPLEREEAGSALIADCDRSRRDLGGIVRDLKQK